MCRPITRMSLMCRLAFALLLSTSWSRCPLSRQDGESLHLVQRVPCAPRKPVAPCGRAPRLRSDGTGGAR